MKIVLATNNQHKLDEFRLYFADYDVEISSLKDEGINANPDETGTTFKENALIKAEEIAKFTNEIVIADDSGLEIHALNNFPGVYSSRFMDGHSYKEKFIAINEMLKDKENKKANFNCTLCVLNLEKEPLYFEGKTFGEIIEKPQGDGNFGYDPVFYYPPLNKTFAELSQKEKNEVSHRGNALKLLINYLIEKKYI